MNSVNTGKNTGEGQRSEPRESQQGFRKDQDPFEPEHVVCISLAFVIAKLGDLWFFTRQAGSSANRQQYLQVAACAAMDPGDEAEGTDSSFPQHR